ncbi:SRSO17 transposase [Paraburkholderia sp. BL17N1]|nr:SRSO17 transposase [Paraburkholderia sp. BL17N1]RKR31207.1 SRSO17 transposase [Paraburkholderia sp. BL17N1]RKR38251.1 SRSO17 transposase [Paraburkholderia sp. BL17N1]RKR38347.1 SRSO17 transposase [Paraburkholderia sp. BL17N1]RKR38349.1 SRSO17 transposase [Paraburkholderia sp. BL17N1]
MDAQMRFEQYIEHLSGGLGHADRHSGLRGYCTGLMLPLTRKSVEPMAASVDPLHASARHQALHHFVAKADWSDDELLLRVSQWVVPRMDFSGGGFWIVDDTGFPKKGRHSVGVARQYCGVLGKQDNCQVAVSVSLACEQASIPVAWQLYVPREWAEDDERREKAGIPAQIGFETKAQIALRQIEALLAAGAPRHCVLADAGYGIDNAFRQRLDDLGLSYVVGITSALVVWPPGVEPLPPKPYGGMGRPPVVPRRTRARQPVNVKDLAHSLPATAFTTLSWREGSNETLSGRFAAVRVRHAGGNTGKARLRPEQWLLIEWPAGDADPLKYYLSNLPADTALEQLVAHAHMRWRIERDYQDLKQELGLGHYEGRGWRGFHHHAALAIAAYGFLLSERLATGTPVSAKKNFAARQTPAVPDDYIARGSPTRTAPHG